MTEPDPEAVNNLFSEHLDELKNATAKMAFAAAMAYKAQDPGSYAAMKAGFDKGLLEIGVTVHISPRPFVEVFMLGADGQRHVFFSMTGKEIGSSAPRLN